MSQNNTTTLEQRLAFLEKRNAELEAKAKEAAKPRTLSLKVGQSGGASLYGMGRFPVTLYKEQWRKLLAHKDQIEAFLTENDSMLKAKGDATDTATA